MGIGMTIGKTVGKMTNVGAKTGSLFDNMRKRFNENYENQQERNKINYSESDFGGTVNTFSFLQEILESIKRGFYEAQKENLMGKFKENLGKMKENQHIYDEYLDKKKGIIDDIVLEKEKNSFAGNVAKKAIIAGAVGYLVDKGLSLASDYAEGKITSENVTKVLDSIQINPKELLEKFNITNVASEKLQDSLKDIVDKEAANEENIQIQRMG